MNALRLTVANRRNNCLETRVETVVSMAVAAIGALSAQVEKN